MTIFERMAAGELIRLDDPDYGQVEQAIVRAFELTGKLNTRYHDVHETRAVLGQLTQRQIDPSTIVIPPFYTDFGQFIRLGKGVFVNFGCAFMDRGGITIEEGALIGPQVKLITENHAEEPALRAYVYSKPILIKKQAWIGAGATILPGVTVGVAAIVGAGSVVTKDVPDYAVVAGVPARVVRMVAR